MQTQKSIKSSHLQPSSATPPQVHKPHLSREHTLHPCPSCQRHVRTLASSEASHSCRSPRLQPWLSPLPPPPRVPTSPTPPSRPACCRDSGTYQRTRARSA